MQRLAWHEEHGRVAWTQVGPRWLGAWERLRARDGFYASSRGSMVAFVLDGDMHIDVAGEERDLAPGAALLIRGTVPFRYHMEAGTRLFLTEVSGVVGGEGLACVSAAEMPRGAARAFAQVDETSASSLVHVAEAADGLYQLAGTPIAPLRTQSAARMLRVKAHLEAHFRDPELRIQDVARRFGVDSFYLARHFARVVGMPPKAYLQWLRLEHFLRSLLSQPRAVLDTALDAGFSDYATFSRRVRRQLGTPPSELVAT